MKKYILKHGTGKWTEYFTGEVICEEPLYLPNVKSARKYDLEQAKKWAKLLDCTIIEVEV